MKVIREIDTFIKPPCGIVATIGNFDGVHLGHRKIFRTVVQVAQKSGCKSAVITFDPHPLKLLAPERAPLLINTEDEKERLILASKVDYVFPIKFDELMAAVDAEVFAREFLRDIFGVKRLVIGYDYAFGRGRSGTAETMKTFGEKYGFEVEVLPAFHTGGQVHASTHIRHLVQTGDVAKVVGFLGRNFNLAGDVIHGAKRGTALGFPTANIITEKELIPCEGVYAVKVKYSGKMYDGVVNIGWNPTFGDGKKSVEVHILNFNRDIYGEQLRIYFVERLRAEQKFDSVDELKSSINKDVSLAVDILQKARVLEYKEYLAT